VTTAAGKAPSCPAKSELHGCRQNGSCTLIEKPDDAEYTYFEYNDARLLRAAHVLPEDRWDYFHYDGQLARYCIEDSAGCKYYYWDGLDLLARTNLTTGASRSFVHGQTPIPGIGNMVDYSEDGATHTFHYDHRGTVFGITDGSQDVSQTYEHDAWGVKLSEAGTLENPIQYQGCAWLRSADGRGLSLSGPRTYQPTLGRFFQRDPHSDEYAIPKRSGGGGLTCQYVSNVPTVLVDASGRRAEVATAPGTATYVGAIAIIWQWMEKELIVGRIDRYMRSLEMKPGAECFDVSGFRSKIIGWLDKQNPFCFSTLQPPTIGASHAVYSAVMDILFVWNLKTDTDAQYALHEAIHFYDDKHNIYLKFPRGLIGLFKDPVEKFGHAPLQLIELLDQVATFLGRLCHDTPQPFATCGGMKAAWQAINDRLAVTNGKTSFGGEETGGAIEKEYFEKIYEEFGFGLSYECLIDKARRCLAAQSLDEPCCLEESTSVGDVFWGWRLRRLK